MNKIIYTFSFAVFLLVLASPVLAQSADLAKIQTFVQSIIQALVAMAGVLASCFFVWGGIGYITSSGNPEHLERSKRTIVFSALGLAITLAAFVITNIVTQLAASAFG